MFASGDAAKTDAAFAAAAKVVKRRYVITRVYAHYMQPRGVLASYDEGDGRYTIHADVRYPHRVRNALVENIFRSPSTASAYSAATSAVASAPRAGNTPSIA